MRIGRRRAAIRHAQEAVALAELAVLVAAAGDERAVQSHRRDVERHDVEMVIGVDQQLGAMRRACRRHAIESGTIAAVSKSTDDTSTASVRSFTALASAIGQRVHRMRGDLRHLDAFVGESIHLTADRVELAVGGDEPLTAGGTAGPTASAITSSCVFCPSAMLAGVSPSSRANPARTSSACSAARSHFSSTNSAASSQARCCAVEPHVRPRLVRMAGQQQAFADAEPRIVTGQGLAQASTPSYATLAAA